MDYDTLKMIWGVIDDMGDAIFTNSIEYRSCKSKMLSGRFEEITKKEYKEFAGAMKTAESKCNKFGAKDMAFALRRVLYHADEEGLPELAKLKKKYKWSFL